MKYYWHTLCVLSVVTLTASVITAQTPQITSISPSSGPVGSTIKIFGNNFGSYGFGAQVLINGTSATPPTPSLWTANEVDVMIPYAAAPTGVVSVCPSSCSNGWSFTVTNTLALESANNTSACSPSSNPTNNPSYCSGYFNGFSDTKNSQSQLQTYMVDSPAGHISLTEHFSQMFNPNSKAGVICEYQPWFGSSGHKSVGYNENNAATVHAQISNMIARGCSVIWIDWYGTSAAQQFNLTTTNLVWSDIYNRHDPNINDGSGSGGWPIKFAILEDQGSWSATCPGFKGITAISESGATVTVSTSSPTGVTVGSSVMVENVPISGYNGTWTVTSVTNSTQFTYSAASSGLSASSGGSAGKDQTSCIQSVIQSDLSYIDAHYAGGLYWTYPYWTWGTLGTSPVVGFFVCQSCFNANWTSIWQNVQSYAQTKLQFGAYFFYEFGHFGDSWSNGEYGWPHPVAWSSTNQFTWDSGNYLTNLYTQGQQAYTGTFSPWTIGSLYKGFDDNNASWGTNRVMAQQCGQVLLNTANFTNMTVAEFMQVATWNDYEEGTEIETGVDNCYTIQASLSQSTLTWSLNASSSYATTGTINHYTVYYADASNNLFVAAANVPTSTSSLDLSTVVPTGTWTIYVEMVGQPSIINRMSSGVTYIH